MCVARQKEILVASKQRSELMQSGLGASEIGTVAGLNPWAGPYDVWEARFHPEVAAKENYLMRRGKALEPGILELLELEIGSLIIRKIDTRVCEQDPICFATPDGLLDGCPVEVKAPGPFTGYEWSDEDGDAVIPDRYVAQSAWQMRATDAPRGLVAADLGNSLFHKWLHRDTALENDLLEVAHSFWTSFVLPGIPPPVDATDQAKEFLDRRFPRDKESMIEWDNLPESERKRVEQMVRHGMLARAAVKEAEAVYQGAKNTFKEYLGEFRGVQIPGIGNATWKNNRPKEVTQWRTLAELLLSAMEDRREAERILSEYRKVVPGPRVLRFPPEKKVGGA